MHKEQFVKEMQNLVALKKPKLARNDAHIEKVTAEAFDAIHAAGFNMDALLKLLKMSPEVILGVTNLLNLLAHPHNEPKSAPLTEKTEKPV